MPPELTVIVPEMEIEVLTAAVAFDAIVRLAKLGLPPAAIDDPLFIVNVLLALQALVRRLGELGIDAYGLDLTRPRFAIPVARIIAPVVDGRLRALNAATGKVLWETRVSPANMPYTITMAPRVIKGGKIIIGVSGGEVDQDQAVAEAGAAALSA